MNRYRCDTCKTDLTKTAPSESDQVLPDESLIVNREYKDFGGALAYPSDIAVEAAHQILTAFDKTFSKNLHGQGMKKRIVHKAKQLIHYKIPHFLKFGESCADHRLTFMEKVIIAKIRRAVVDISKNLRQPHCKNNKLVAKLYKLTNR